MFIFSYPLFTDFCSVPLTLSNPSYFSSFTDWCSLPLSLSILVSSLFPSFTDFSSIPSFHAFIFVLIYWSLLCPSTSFSSLYSPFPLPPPLSKPYILLSLVYWLLFPPSTSLCTFIFFPYLLIVVLFLYLFPRFHLLLPFTYCCSISLPLTTPSSSSPIYWLLSSPSTPSHAFVSSFPYLPIFPCFSPSFPARARQLANTKHSPFHRPISPTWVAPYLPLSGNKASIRTRNRMVWVGRGRGGEVRAGRWCGDRGAGGGSRGEGLSCLHIIRLQITSIQALDKWICGYPWYWRGEYVSHLYGTT